MMFLGISIWLWMAFIFSLAVIGGTIYVLYNVYKVYSVQKQAAERNKPLSKRISETVSEDNEEEIEEDSGPSFFADNDDIFISEAPSLPKLEEEEGYEYVERTELSSKEPITLQELQYEEYDKEKTGRLSSGKIVQKISRDPSRNTGASSIWDLEDSTPIAPRPVEDDFPKRRRDIHRQAPASTVSDDDTILNEYNGDDVWEDEADDSNIPVKPSSALPTRKSLRQQERGL